MKPAAVIIALVLVSAPHALAQTIPGILAGAGVTATRATALDNGSSILTALVEELERNNPEVKAARREVDVRVARIAPVGGVISSFAFELLMMRFEREELDLTCGADVATLGSYGASAEGARTNRLCMAALPGGDARHDPDAVLGYLRRSAGGVHLRARRPRVLSDAPCAGTQFEALPARSRPRHG